MPHIVLTEEQMRIITEAGGPVDVRDAEGRPVASMQLLTAEEIELIERWKRKRDSGSPQSTIPGWQVQAHFRRLEEIRQQEGMDLPKALELLRRMRAGEQV